MSPAYPSKNQPSNIRSPEQEAAIKAQNIAAAKTAEKKEEEEKEKMKKKKTCPTTRFDKHRVFLYDTNQDKDMMLLSRKEDNKASRRRKNSRRK
ncbi:uncharacterized protein J4E79_002449 [Alternaria viburni]|uniref:uncharacterized protein n=1 Tax=Alternaria viburni TaxID=566460 RepID=UPI0020C4015B|nr:uncharacterized protein J4E79_002449 [Alternaria viburni]KAI4666411.1 hypothetical protein J4E79_002449 [Alternaria viburni]